ncbi:MAG: hypothetical protein V4671_32975 [Armatimonadota bacterium]
MKFWLFLFGRVLSGAFAGSLVLENLTRGAVFQFVPKIHDVEFVIVTTIVSILGGIFGAVSVVSFLAAKVQQNRLAGWLALIFGGLGLVLPLMSITKALQAFDNNSQPLFDTAAYFGFSLIWSSGLVIWGISLVFNRQLREIR